jgi:osmotically-inducible protein OsmY
MNGSLYNLQHQIQAAFMDDHAIKDDEIEVFDNNGVITLRGTVSTPAARDRAEELVRSLESVTSVINELDVA